MSDQTDSEGQGGGRRRRASGGAEARRAARRAGDNVQMPAIVRKIAEYEVLDEAGLALIEHNADLILEQHGIDIRDDDETVALWKAAGADVKYWTDPKGIEVPRLHFPRGLCRKIIQASAPRKFKQFARNPERSVEIGGKTTVFAPVYGPPFVRDLKGERRYGTIQDFQDLVKLAYMAPAIHHSGGTVCEPVDVRRAQAPSRHGLCAHQIFRQAVHGLGDRAEPRGRYGDDGADAVRRKVRRRELRADQPDQRQLADDL